jgi:hypothetical protein
MKKTFLILAIGAALAAGPAFADDSMRNAYGNTFVVTQANGAVVRYHFNADATFDVVTADGHTTPGTYQIANGQICLTPTGQDHVDCAPYAGEKNVGDTWTQQAADGSQISVTLQAGR